MNCLRFLCIVGVISLLLPGCRSPMHAAMAAANIAIGMTAAGMRRSTGDCFTGCYEGTRCNRKTGLCETMPCHGTCSKGEECDNTGPVPRCIPVVHDDDLRIEKGPEEF